MKSNHTKKHSPAVERMKEKCETWWIILLISSGIITSQGMESSNGEFKTTCQHLLIWFAVFEKIWCISWFLASIPALFPVQSWRPCFELHCFPTSPFPGRNLFFLVKFNTWHDAVWTPPHLLVWNADQSFQRIIR